MREIRLPTAILFYLEKMPVIVEYKGNVCTVKITGATQDFVYTYVGVSESFARDLAEYLHFGRDFEEALKLTREAQEKRVKDSNVNPF